MARRKQRQSEPDEAANTSRANIPQAGEAWPTHASRSPVSTPISAPDSAPDQERLTESATARQANRARPRRAKAPTPPPPAALAPQPAAERAPKAEATKPVIIAGTRHPSTRRAPKAAHIGLRSKAARIVALAGIVVAVFGALAISAPLGAQGGLGGAFQAYANAAPWSAPKPTATPRPVTGANPGQQAIIDDIQAVFGPYAPGALNIARCESSFDPNAYNATPVAGSHAQGVFQILYPSTWNTTSYRDYSPYNSWANIRAAYEIFKRDGYSWREWACKSY